MEKRLFTFGCSFTNFFWPTWADILGKEFDTFENWGKNGAGNAFMLYSLMECIKRNTLTKNDTVVIMWSSIDREDRWVHGSWQLEGGVFNGQEPYTGDYVKKFADPTGFIIRDLAIISATKKILESIGCKWYFLSMVPIYYQDKADAYDSKIEYKFNQQILDLYKEELECIRPSIYESVFKEDWYSRPGYVDLSFFKQSYENLKGADWPNVQDFIKQNLKAVSKNILNEITYAFRLDKNRIRTDTHPIPIEHLEYIENILPEIVISKKTKQWVQEVNTRVLNLDPMYANNFRGTWRSNNPKRF